MTDQPEDATIADAFAVPLHLIDASQPVEYCGHETILPISQVSTECVLRPGHSGSHADHKGTRWRLATVSDHCLDNPALTTAIGYPVRCPHCDTTVPPTHWTKHIQRHHPDQAKTAALAEIDRGYCPHCGRGDCAPTADQWYEQQQRAEQAEARLDAALKQILADATRHELDGRSETAAGLRIAARHLLAAQKETP